jgi:hypothetical protein
VSVSPGQDSWSSVVGDALWLVFVRCFSRSYIIGSVRKMIFSIKVRVTLLDYLKIPQVTLLSDLHV